MDASSIRTDNLRLIDVEPFHVEALSRDKRELAEVLGVAVPDGWPQFPEAFVSAKVWATTASTLASAWAKA